MLAWVRGLGRLVIQASETSGFGLVLAAQTIQNLPCLGRFRRIRDILDLLYAYTLIALPVTALVSIVIGMILAIGMGVTLATFGQEFRIGWLVSATLIREMGPLMTAFILAASLGSGVAAEIGTMKVSEEIDALEVMSISPIRFLVIPRMIALMLITPAMTVFANYIGILGGGLVANSQFGVSFVAYRLQALEAIDLRDMKQSLLKAAVFGVIIGLVGCTQGLRTSGGATGVGRATRRAVVVSFLLVLVVGYVLSVVIYRLGWIFAP